MHSAGLDCMGWRDLGHSRRGPDTGDLINFIGHRRGGPDASDGVDLVDVVASASWDSNSWRRDASNRIYSGCSDPTCDTS